MGRAVRKIERMRTQFMGQKFLTFVPEDDECFSMTAWKILKSQEISGVIPCRRMRYNGREKWYYLISEYTRLTQAAGCWQAEELLNAALNLTDCILRIRQNGWLKLRHTDWQPDHIFVNMHTQEVYLVVLPLMDKAVPDHGNRTETAIREVFLSMLEYSACADHPALQSFYAELQNQPKIPEGLREAVRDARRHLDLRAGGQALCLEAAACYGNCRIYIDQKDCVIGKQVSVVDQVVQLSPAISRRHCRICRRGDGYFIEDLGSSNHTYVNGELLSAGEPVPLRDGDTVCLADVEFQVRELS